MTRMSGDGPAYLDASAIVKLVVDEHESPGLLHWYREVDRAVTSRIGVIETRRRDTST